MIALTFEEQARYDYANGTDSYAEAGADVARELEELERSQGAIEAAAYQSGRFSGMEQSTREEIQGLKDRLLGTQEYAMRSTAMLNLLNRALRDTTMLRTIGHRQRAAEALIKELKSLGGYAK